MKTLLIAAAAMAGGAALGFFLCWAAHRLTRGNYTPARRMAAAKKRKKEKKQINSGGEFL